MPFNIVRNDITKMKVDVIVNATNSILTGEGGVDGAIHRAAGHKLLEKCITLNGCKTGEAKITKGYDLPAKYVIHTVGPVWRGGNNGEEKLLESCYKSSLKLAKNNNLESIAFPLISSGAYGFPKDKALKIAMQVIGEFLLINDMIIYLVVFDKTSVALSEKLFLSIKQYIDDKYIEDEQNDFRDIRAIKEVEQVYAEEYECYCVEEPPPKIKKKRSLQDIFENMDETFTEMLLRLIDEKGMTDSKTYKKANIDRKLFSKIRKDKDYKPSKVTAIAFVIALELNLDEAKDLLLKAGFALSRSSKFDVIIEYFIEERNYNIFEINEALFTFNQKLLVNN